MLICVLLSSNLHGFTDLFQSDLVMSSLVTTVFNSSPGGGLPYETDGDARRLA